MSKILFSRGIRTLKTGKRSAKDYPFWDKLIELLKADGYDVEEITERPLEALKTLIESSLTVICNDSFIQHFCWSIGKKAIVIFGKSDPLKFGHEENINLLKDRKYLRGDQWRWWDDIEFSEEVFVSPETVLEEVKKLNATK